jgi:hypothetical protein
MKTIQVHEPVRSCSSETEKMKKLHIILTVVLLSPAILYGQFQIDWQQSYGSMGYDDAYDIVQTEGGYIIAGNVDFNGGQVTCNTNGGHALWMVKIDCTGNQLWDKCIENAGVIKMINVVNSTDFYLIGGGSGSPYWGIYNLWIARLDSDANIIWERILGNSIGILSGDQYGFATSDGGIIASAHIDSQGGDITNWYGGYDGWVIKLDSNGNTQWDYTIGSSNSFEFINCIIECSQGGYLAGLYGAPKGAGTGNVDCYVQSYTKPDAIVFKMDTNSNPEWHRCYGGSEHEGVVSILEIDDGYMLACFGGSNDGDLEGSGFHGGYYDVWLVKIDFDGNIIWQKCYGGSGDDFVYNIFQTSDGGFVVFSDTDSEDGDVIGNHSDLTDIWVFKIDGSGELLWSRCIGSYHIESFASAVQLSDNKYTIAGSMARSPAGDINCSNFVPGSHTNYWAFGISDTMVGIAEQGKPDYDEYIKIYPNPTDHFIDCRWAIADGRFTISIFNIYGRKQDEIIIPPGQEQITLDVSRYPSGVYIAVLKDENRVVARGKFVKR